MLLVFLAVAPVWSTESLCRTPQECGLADGLCGASDPNARLSRSDPATLCVGFQGQNGGPGKKALFNVQVDHYSTLSVDTCARTTPWKFPARRAPSSQRSPPRRAPPIAPVRTLMGADWNAKEAYSHMWVGVNGRRTIGQRAGVTDGRGTCNATVGGAAPASELPEGVSVCYGWAEHNKPIVLPTNQLATGLTAVIHLDMGRVNRVVWDSSCNLVRMPRRSRARAPTQPRARAHVALNCCACPRSAQNRGSRASRACPTALAWLAPTALPVRTATPSCSRVRAAFTTPCALQRSTSLGSARTAMGSPSSRPARCSRASSPTLLGPSRARSTTTCSLCTTRPMGAQGAPAPTRHRAPRRRTRRMRRQAESTRGRRGGGGT